MAQASAAARGVDAGRRRPFHVMAKPTGPACNLACDYCFYLDTSRLFPDPHTRMSEDVLSRYLEQLFAGQPDGEVVVAWQGGEPTLRGIDFYRKAVELERRFARPGQTVLNTLQTNGVLLDRPWVTFLRRQGFLVGLSIDGPAEVHDAYRRNHAGRPSFAAVRRAVDLLTGAGVPWNALTTVHAANQDRGREVYCFLRDECGARFMQFIPVVTPLQDVGGSWEPGEWAVRPGAYGRFLVDVFEDWVRRDVGSVFVQMFDTTLGNTLGEPGGLCVHQPACGDAVVLEHDGSVYACDHFVDARHRLGSIMDRTLLEMVESPAQLAFKRAKGASLPQVCRHCPVRRLCHGGCPKDRFVRAADDGAPGNYLCPDYRLFFQHVATPMAVMCQALRRGASPDHVMEVYARADERRRPEDRCTCGRDRAWSDCHGRAPSAAHRAEPTAGGTPD
ncbi:anaerobic sulfatase maturase [Nocardioides taihuensis]|uniref:Anaerobic sulfatase maturase n=1 Tax=Nocardioides taihuensis TaxID=1835606 RepID=A0ABW0BG30_9ACTN